MEQSEPESTHQTRPWAMRPLHDSKNLAYIMMKQIMVTRVFPKNIKVSKYFLPSFKLLLHLDKISLVAPNSKKYKVMTQNDPKLHSGHIRDTAIAAIDTIVDLEF